MRYRDLRKDTAVCEGRAPWVPGVRPRFARLRVPPGRTQHA